MSGLPPGWANTEIGVIAATQLGKMLSQKAKVGTEPRPYLRNKSIQWGRIDLDDLPTMDFDPDELERFEVVDGDLLVCEGGEVGRAAIYRGQLDWVGYQKALHRVRPVAGVSAEFLLYCFMWLAQSHALEKHVTGSTINHLPQEDLRQIATPLPPLNEQRRIVAAIEEHLSRLDAADASLAAAATRATGLRSAIIRDATVGLLPREPLGTVATVNGGHTPKGLAHVPGGKLPFFKVGDMNFAEGARMGRSRTYLDASSAERFRVKIWPAGTVIFPKQGGAIATNKKRFLDAPAACDLNTMGVIPSNRLVPEFLLLCLEAIDLMTLSDGSVVAQIKPSRVAELEVPVPPINDQSEIVARAEALLSHSEAIRVVLERTQHRSTSLRRGILERAFRGELVPQDPSEEPAAVLLDRIRAERAVTASQPRGRRVNR